MITLPKGHEGREGQHGSYVKLSPSVGVKVLHSKVHKTQRAAYSSNSYKLAVQEVEILRQAFDSGVVPQCYGITLVRVKGGYRVGVLLQHLGVTTIDKSEFSEDNAIEVMDYIKEELRQVGIIHGDLNEDNIMVYRGKCYAIDFSPQCIDFE